MFLILIHELGHVVGGLLFGFRFKYIRIGPVRIDRSRKITWHLSRSEVASGDAGVSPTSDTGIRWRFCAFLASGSIANFTTSFLTFRLMPRDNSLAAALDIAIFLGSAFMGVVNLLPLRVAGQMTDGFKIFILLFTKARKERFLHILKFVAESNRGTCNTSSEEVHPALLIQDGSEHQVVASLLAYSAALRAKDYELAARSLESCLVAAGSVKSDLREELIINAAQYQVVRRKRPDLAREWLAERESGCRSPRRFFAEALILHHEDQFDLAHEKIDEGLEQISSLPEGTDRAALEKALRALKQATQDRIPLSI